MSLTLTIIKSPEGISQAIDHMVFSGEGGSIGRGPDNNWVLPDPERFLSSRHCEVQCDGGQYFVVDQSTNGTFLNGASEPIGKGGRVQLASGDQFEIGEYHFQISLEDSGFAASDPFGASPFAENTATEDSQFSVKPGSPFAEGVNFGENLSLTPDPEKLDPLAAFDDAGGGDPFGKPAASPANFPIDDPFQQQQQPVADENISGGSFDDGANALSQNVDWPEASQQSVIPENWDDDLMGSGGAEDSLMDEPPPAIAARPSPKPNPRQARPSPEPRPRQTRKAREELRKPRPEAAAKSAKPRGGRGQSLVIDTLIETMGLNSEDFDDEQKREIGRIAGELMREVTVGMMQLLRSRTSLKNEFRMNVTTIQPIENNPLKFSANVEEALENMFVRQSSAYKKPVDSFREGYQSIAEHQIAIIAGVRAAFKSIMEGFNPESLAKSFDRGKKGAGLPVVQKAKYWTAYTEYYESLVDNMEHSFQHLFGDNFVQAYEDQLSKLAAQRKNNP